MVLSCCHDCPCGAATMSQLLNGRDFLNVTVADYFGPEGPPPHCPAAAALLQRSSWRSMQNVFGIMSASAGLVWDATPAGPRTRAATATRVDEGTEAPGVGAPRPPRIRVCIMDTSSFGSPGDTALKAVMADPSDFTSWGVVLQTAQQVTCNTCPRTRHRCEHIEVRCFAE